MANNKLPSEGTPFTLDHVELPPLLAAINLTISALEKYGDWIGKYGHESIATAEGLADALLNATDELGIEAWRLRWHYNSATTSDSGLFVVLKSVEEIVVRITSKIPNDPELPGDEPLMIRLSEGIQPVLFGEMTLAQLHMLRDAVTEWNSRPASTTHHTPNQPQPISRQRIAKLLSVTVKTLANRASELPEPIGRTARAEPIYDYSQARLKLIVMYPAKAFLLPENFSDLPS